MESGLLVDLENPLLSDHHPVDVHCYVDWEPTC